MQRRSKPVHHGMEEVVPLRSREESDYSRSKRRRNPSWRHPRSYLVLFLIISTAAFWYTQLTTPERRTIFRENSNYRWKRLVWRWKAPQPVGTLTASLSTRRQVLQLESTGSSNSEREMHLVERHLQLLDQDMNVSVSESTNTNNKTVVLVWSGSYPFWFANVKMGADTSCNIPCEWTTDRTYDRSKVSGLVCLLYQMEKGQCRDINPHLWKNRPILGVSWENDWKGSETVPRLDELPASQLWKLKRQSPYNLISSHELDSHIPVLYSDLADFIDEFKVQSLNQLVQERQDKKASVMFTISNCQAPLRPDRLEIMDSLSSYFPTSSYGKCLGEEEHMRLPWNSRDNYQSSKFVQEMSKYLFIYAPENSYGIDYVTEVSDIGWPYCIVLFVVFSLNRKTISPCVATESLRTTQKRSSADLHWSSQHCCILA